MFRAGVVHQALAGWLGRWRSFLDALESEGEEARQVEWGRVLDPQERPEGGFALSPGTPSQRSGALEEAADTFSGGSLDTLRKQGHGEQEVPRKHPQKSWRQWDQELRRELWTREVWQLPDVACSTDPQERLRWAEGSTWSAAA